MSKLRDYVSYLSGALARERREGNTWLAEETARELAEARQELAEAEAERYAYDPYDDDDDPELRARRRIGPHR